MYWSPSQAQLKYSRADQVDRHSQTLHQHREPAPGASARSQRQENVTAKYRQSDAHCLGHHFERSLAESSLGTQSTLAGDTESASKSTPKKVRANHNLPARLLFRNQQTSAKLRLILPRGVIGNTTDFGSVILGSSPSGVAEIEAPESLPLRTATPRSEDTNREAPEPAGGLGPSTSFH